MKKHFLLLLMAFFSLTGWAQTVTEVSVNFSKIKYGGGAPVMEVTYNGIKRVITKDATATYASKGNPEFYWDGKYYTDKNCATVATTPLVVLAEDKHYYVKLKGTEGSIFQDLEPTGWFDVEPVELTVTNIDKFGKKFGEADPKITLDDITFTGFVLSENKDVLKEATGGITYKYELKGEKYLLKTIEGIEGKDAPNYTIKPGEGVEFTIEPADLPAKTTGKYTFTAKEGTYKAAKFTGDELPTIAIEGLTAGTDYEIKWYEAPAGEATIDNICTGDPVEPTNAGTYYGLVKGKVNYTGTQKDLTWKFTIAKKDLVIYVKNAEKTYDGKAATIAADAVVLSGLISTDEKAEEITGAISAAFKDAGDKKNADEYVMIPVIKTSGAAITADNWTYNNYNPKPLETGIFTIKKATLTVTAIPQTFEYDGKDWSTRIDTKISDKTVAIAGTVTGEEETVAKLFTIEAAKTEMKEIDTYEDAILIVATEDAANSNYELDPKNGKVIVGNKNLVILAPTFSQQYGYKVKKSELSVVNNAGIKDASGWKTAPVFTITKGDKTYEDGALLDEIGEYTVKISNWDALAPDGFTLVESNVYDGVLTITPKEITPTIVTQVVAKGSGLKQQKDDETLVSFGKDLVQEGEKIKWTLKFNTYTGDEVDGLINSTQINDGKIKDDALDKTYTKGITFDVIDPATVDAEKYANAKYEIVWTATGKLIVGEGSAAALKLDRAAEEATKLPAAVIEDHAGETQDVTFGELKMKEQEWYAMVLPFATSAKELVNELNTYVVVNTLSEKSTDQSFKFTLEMGDIPAGKPFIIKPAEAIDWSKANLVLYEDGDLIPEGKKIGDVKEYKSAKFEGKTIVSEITPYGADGIIMIYGTYESQILGVDGKPAGEGADITDRSWWLSDTGYEATVVANDWRKPKNKPHTLAPMEAYLVAAEGWTTYSPVITVEDFDGQTTAIKTLNADKINGLNVSEGWYNLNGVKLQGAPTKKGVYINNGQKVIIK